MNLQKRFENKVKNKKFKHYNVDQTINETLDEMNYENELDDYIKKIAQQSSNYNAIMAVQSNSSSRHSFDSNGIDTKEAVSDSSDSSRFKCRSNDNKLLINYHSTHDNNLKPLSSKATSSGNGSTCSSNSSCTCGSISISSDKSCYSHGGYYKLNNNVLDRSSCSSSSEPRISCQQGAKSKLHENHEVVKCSTNSQYALLEHAFNMAKRCNNCKYRFQNDDYYSKFMKLIKDCGNQVMRSVASNFILFSNMKYKLIYKNYRY